MNPAVEEDFKIPLPLYRAQPLSLANAYYYEYHPIFYFYVVTWVLFQLLSVVSTRGKFAPKGTVMGFMRKICFWSFTFLRFLAHSFQTPWNWDWERCLFETVLFIFSFGCSGFFFFFNCMTAFFICGKWDLPSSCSVWASHCSVIFSCGAWAPKVRGLQWLWHVGLAALWHVESSWTGDGNPIPCFSK